jgi:small subunit ribosomal protein S2
MNQVLERTNTTREHLAFWLRRHWPSETEPLDRETEAAAEGDGADDEGALPLFVWGAITALVLWWLYLRPATPERRLRKVNTLRANPRPGPRPGSRPANAAPSARRGDITPAQTAVAEDDLTRVYGIGPARAARLREAGIATFAALAMADADQLRDILEGVGGNPADLSTWPEQASLAAKGDWDGLQAAQEQLRAARA